MAESKDFVLGMVVGSAIGAAVALLYAPQSGTETRVFLKTKADEAKDRTAEAANQARGRATEVVNTAQARLGEVKGQVQTKASEITHQAQDLVDRGRQAVEHQKEAVVSAVEAGKQAYKEKQSQLQEEVADDTLPPAPLS